MKLLSLRVEQLRRFRQPLEITDFSPGINLFSGPNESGKSTLVRAIRAAFFERHRSSSVDDLQPWGDSSAAPAVALSFECQGRRWHLHKSFLKKKRCDLQVDDRSFSGEEAEEKLAELLGFQFPGRGASKAEHWGIPGLLWIEQGDGHQLRDAVGHAGDYLKSALGGALGEIASSAGDEVMVEVEQQRAVLLTSTGRPTGEYARVIAQHDVLQKELQTLDANIDTYRQQVDRLGALRRQQSQDEAEKSWETYRRQAQQARDRLGEVGDWIEQQKREVQALKNCSTQLELIRRQLADHQQQLDRLQERMRQDEAARAAVGLQREGLPAMQERVKSAQLAYEQARRLMLSARNNEQRQLLQRERTQLAERLQALGERLAQARRLQAELHELRAQHQTLRIEPKPLAQLRKLQSELDALEIRQRAVATRLTFDLLPGQQLQIADETVSGATERLLLTATELTIAGIGRIRIQPGGDEVSELARRQQSAQDALHSALAESSVASLTEAEQRAQRCQVLQQEIATREALLSSLAPQGADALETEQQGAIQRDRQLEEQLAGLPPADEQVPALAAAEAQLESAERQLRSAEKQEADLRQELALAERSAEAATQELARLRAEMENPERQQRAQGARQQLTDLRADEERLQASIATLQQQIDLARPDILNQDVARLEGTARELEKAAAQRREELIALQAGVQAQGAEGLEERRAERALECEDVTRRRDEMARRAGALDLLLDLLRVQRQALTRRLQAPLQKHLDRYLQLLFPQGRLAVDENLIPHQLSRPSGQAQEIGNLDALSFGAREQMGLISRLAYADFLKEAGRPTLIILDDALVHSDAERLSLMKRILFDAGQRHQILLFTCHPQNWRDLGVAARDMSTLVNSG